MLSYQSVIMYKTFLELINNANVCFLTYQKFNENILNILHPIHIFQITGKKMTRTTCTHQKERKRNTEEYTVNIDSLLEILKPPITTGNNESLQ